MRRGLGLLEVEGWLYPFVVGVGFIMFMFMLIFIFMPMFMPMGQVGTAGSGKEYIGK